MVYKVTVTVPALEQIQKQYEHILLSSEQYATKWVDDIFDSIDSLETMPERCYISKHSVYFTQEVRTLVLGKYLIDFRINENLKEVQILSVWHSALGEPPE